MVKFTIRQLEILKIISSCNEYINSKAITSDLDITRRTLINDIKHINQEKEIIISNNKGYLINDSFIEEIDDILADYQIEEENVDKIIKYILIKNNSLTVNEITEYFYISASKFLKLLPQINAQLKLYDLKIE